MICGYCGIDRDELYMGGGLYVYRCPKCGEDMIMVAALYCQGCGVKLEWNLSGYRG